MKTTPTPATNQPGRPTRPIRQLGRVLLVLAAAFLLSTGLQASNAIPPEKAATCAGVAGVQMAGHRFTAEDLSERPNFKCADLRGATLVGLQLTQVDFTGAQLENAKLANAELSQAEMTDANLVGADLSNADLIQATLNGAKLSGAILSGAKMGQAEAKAANFTNANLSQADLSQADLTNATLSGANLADTDFTQATLTGADFLGAKGVARWDIYLMFGAIALFVLLGGTHIASVLKRKSQNAGRTLVVGLLGRLVVVLGLHFFVGGLLGVFGSSFGSPIVELCTGPQCQLGVDRGIWGPFIGVGLVLTGIVIAASVRTRSLPPAPPNYPSYVMNA